MDRWPVQQRIFCVEQYLINKSIVAVQCEFRRMYGEIDNVELHRHGKLSADGYSNGMRLVQFRINLVFVKKQCVHLKMFNV